MTATRPFNLTRIPKTMNANRGMVLEISFNPIRTPVEKQQQHKHKNIGKNGNKIPKPNKQLH